MILSGGADVATNTVTLSRLLFFLHIRQSVPTMAGDFFLLDG